MPGHRILNNEVSKMFTEINNNSLRQKNAIEKNCEFFFFCFGCRKWMRFHFMCRRSRKFEMHTRTYNLQFAHQIIPLIILMTFLFDSKHVVILFNILHFTSLYFSQFFRILFCPSLSLLLTRALVKIRKNHNRAKWTTKIDVMCEKNNSSFTEYSEQFVNVIYILFVR